MILPYLSQTDLRSICLVHRHLHTLAELYLYSEIHFAWQESQPHPITSLLRSILRRPQLATYIRRVMLVGASFYMPHYQGKAPKIPVSEPELEEPLAFVAKTRVSYRKTWSEALQNGTMDAFVAVLLSQPLRLTHLFIGSDFFKESQFLGLVLRSTICEALDCGLRLDFGHLESVSLELYSDYLRPRNIRNTADIFPLFYLPSVKQISASIDNPIAFSWPSTHQPSASSLRSLKLTTIREAYLGQLLMVADQLQSLHWQWFYSPDYLDQVHTPVIDLAQITTGISHVRNTLAELVISAVSYSGGDPDLPPLTIHGSLRAIAGFDKLRRFTAPLIFLMGFSPDGTERIRGFPPPKP